MPMECANWACLHHSSSPGVSPTFPESHCFSSDGVTQLPSSSSRSFSSNGDLPALGPFGLLVLLILICAQLCLTLCDPMDYSLPGSSVHGIFQARILGWVAIYYFRRCSWHRDWTCISCVSCFGREILYQLHHLGSGPSGFLWTPDPNDDLYHIQHQSLGWKLSATAPRNPIFILVTIQAQIEIILEAESLCSTFEIGKVWIFLFSSCKQYV